VAASLTDVMRDLAGVWEGEHPDTQIVVNTGGSSTLARQILEGAPTDVFVSANPDQVDRVAAAGLVAERHDLLRNQLVVIAAPGTASGELKALLAAHRGRIAVGDRAVPIGAYARRYLATQDVASQVEGRLVSFAHSRQVLAAVASRNADLGFVYRTDAAVSGAGVSVVHKVAIAKTGPITYPVAVVKDAGTQARAFATWLRGPEAAAVFQRAGFDAAAPGLTQ